jgi:tRNA U34 2-thiouridine synthase MnmA/TrmU
MKKQGLTAIALVSGGLDSILALAVVAAQNVRVIPLHFRIPFCPLAKTSSGKNIPELAPGLTQEQLRTVDIGEEFLALLKNPAHGFGSQINPCIDCKILMLRKAAGLMREWGASFVVTGEVRGQRPMSQNRQALEIIEKESGLEGMVVRPLCARLLDETIPEKQEWLNRDRLLDFNGRSRKPQIELARSLDIQGYSQPAGGCLLTDPGFAARLKDLIAHKELSLENINLLKVGRHFRLGPGTKLVVGRNEQENNRLSALALDGDYLFMPHQEAAGPTCLGRGVFDQEKLQLACGIARRYSDLKDGQKAEIFFSRVQGSVAGPLTASAAPALEEEQIAGSRI